MLEKTGIMSWSVSPWSSPIGSVSRKTQPEETPQEQLFVGYHALDSLLWPMVKAHSKAQGVLFLVCLPKIDELYAMLNSSTIYLSLECTSVYHHIALLHEAQKKSAFATAFGKFILKKVPIGFIQAPAHFQ